MVGSWFLVSHVGLDIHFRTLMMISVMN